MKLQTINEHQKSLYESFDVNGCKNQLLQYQPYLDRFQNRHDLKILDIGGGSGNFAFHVKQYFSNTAVDAYVLDSTSYDSWNDNLLGREIHFICDSVENMDQLFCENTFDIVFVNRTFHHFVDRTWLKSLAGISKYLISINRLLKSDGALLIMDHFCDGLIWDSAASFLVYTATSIKNPIISKVVRKMGGESAGVGVCFQSEKMWIQRIRKAGFQIEAMEKRDADKMNLIKKTLLLLKGYKRDNIIWARPQK